MGNVSKQLPGHDEKKGVMDMREIGSPIKPIDSPLSRRVERSPRAWLNVVVEWRLPNPGPLHLQLHDCRSVQLEKGKPRTEVAEIRCLVSSAVTPSIVVSPTRVIPGFDDREANG
jgi:hypothetical protein